MTSQDTLQAFSQPANQVASVGMFTACCHLGSFIRALNISQPPRADNTAGRGWVASTCEHQKTGCQCNLNAHSGPLGTVFGDDTSGSRQMPGTGAAGSYSTRVSNMCGVILHSGGALTFPVCRCVWLRIKLGCYNLSSHVIFFFEQLLAAFFLCKMGTSLRVMCTRDLG